MNRWVIYTALFGAYDKLAEPVEKFEGVDFICFTDQEDLNSDIWEIRHLKVTEESPVLMNRRIKMLPHEYLPDYEASIYIDANLKLLKDLRGILENEFSDKSFLVPKHSLRNCVYEEAKECVIFQKSDLTSTVNQLKEYKRRGFPRNFGLSENGILFRKHQDQEIQSLMRQWWEEFQKGSKRDQLSLPFVFWKNGKNLPFVRINSRDEVYFSNQPHKNEEIGWIARLVLSLKIRMRRFVFSFYSFP